MESYISCPQISGGVFILYSRLIFRNFSRIYLRVGPIFKISIQVSFCYLFAVKKSKQSKGIALVTSTGTTL